MGKYLVELKRTGKTEGDGWDSSELAKNCTFHKQAFSEC